MQVRIRETGAVMYEGEFRAYTKADGGPTWNITTDAVLTTLGADVVFEGPQATGGTVYQYSQYAGVEQDDQGRWFTRHILGPVFTNGETPAAEQEADYKAARDADQAKSARSSRNEKLKESDWTQVIDSPVDQTVWATYRQALRDVTAQEGFPWTIIWPTQPE